MIYFNMMIKYLLISSFCLFAFSHGYAQKDWEKFKSKNAKADEKARKEAAKMGPEKKPVDIHEGIESTLLILQHRFKANGDAPEIQLIKKYGELPSVPCHAAQLNQVFLNIISNAIDALSSSETNNPQITIGTEVTTDTVGQSLRQRAIIRIADNGPGMPKEVRSRIFDPFFTTKPVGKGTGLGLSISYKIVVEKHRGKLKCTSKPGEGTEFSIDIPIKQ